MELGLWVLCSHSSERKNRERYDLRKVREFEKRDDDGLEKMMKEMCVLVCIYRMKRETERNVGWVFQEGERI